MRGSDEVEWLRLIYEMSNKDYWNQPIPHRIGFQRFGLELREEDFEQDGTQYRDFSIRDRNSFRKSNSGFSEIKNNDQEFQVTLDVRPFKMDQLTVATVENSYIIIEGEHGEICEDNSICTRKFTRRYILPKGCVLDTLKCVYAKGNLSISFDKADTEDEPKVARMVPVTMDNWVKTRSEPIEVEKEDKNTPLMPENIREVPIVAEVSECSSEGTLESNND